jgi:hypothetical protein
MTQPFRDEYAAALDRAEQLARENEDLRIEVARMRRGPDSAAPAFPSPPPDSVKNRTLNRLEELSAELDAHPAQPGARVAEPGLQVRVAPEVAALAPIPQGGTGERAILDIQPAPGLDVQLVKLRDRLAIADARVKKLESERLRLYIALAVAGFAIVLVAILVGHAL